VALAEPGDVPLVDGLCCMSLLQIPRAAALPNRIAHRPPAAIRRASRASHQTVLGLGQRLFDMRAA